MRPRESDPEALPDPPDASFFLRTRDSAAAMTSDSFYEEDASRQILQRIANVFNDPDICDAVFVVGEEREEICAPSQFMAISSPYFKELFYPPREDARREIRDMEPQVFRKILDYLFRGRVSLSTVEDAWRVKSAGARFQLKDLEDLCTKFLKYRLDSSNLITFLKSSTKYEAQDLKDAVLARFSREANSVLAQDAVLDLSESELISLLETEPSVQASKLMEVLIKWAKKRYGFVGFLFILLAMTLLMIVAIYSGWTLMRSRLRTVAATPTEQRPRERTAPAAERPWTPPPTGQPPRPPPPQWSSPRSTSSSPCRTS